MTAQPLSRYFSRTLAALTLPLALALTGCGSDSEGDDQPDDTGSPSAPADPGDDDRDDQDDDGDDRDDDGDDRDDRN